MNLQSDTAQEILASSHEAIVVVDDDGGIVYANNQAEQLFAYEKGELTGKKVEVLMPDMLREKHAMHRKNFAKSPRARPLVSGLSLKGLRKDGRIFDAEIALTPVETEQGMLYLVAEVATQSDAANNPVSYDAEYFNLGATWALKSGLSLGLAWESLGGDQNVAGAAFRTPLATLHAFQGWADKFLRTPDAGIDDLFATVKYKTGKWSFTGVYHDFTAQSGSADWGTELDLSAGRKLGDRYGLLFKAAMYDADQYDTDTTKFWIMLTANF